MLLFSLWDEMFTVDGSIPYAIVFSWFPWGCFFFFVCFCFVFPPLLILPGIFSALCYHCPTILSNKVSFLFLPTCVLFLLKLNWTSKNNGRNVSNSFIHCTIQITNTLLCCSDKLYWLVHFTRSCIDALKWTNNFYNNTMTNKITKAYIHLI